MITRVWHGWAPATGADAYQGHFRTEVLPNLGRVPGFRGAQLWRREEDGQVEFVAVTTFDSIDAVRRFAGADYERAVVDPEARRVLSRFDERCAHYEVAVGSPPHQGGPDALPAAV
jgi:heme-degrading monooxygenase HmoA